MGLYLFIVASGLITLLGIGIGAFAFTCVRPEQTGADTGPPSDESADHGLAWRQAWAEMPTAAAAVRSAAVRGASLSGRND